MGRFLTEMTEAMTVWHPSNVDTGGYSTYVKLGNYGKVTFLIACGTLGTSVTVKLYQSTTTSGGATMAFNYRKATTGASKLSRQSAAFAAAVADTGVVMTTSTDDYKLLQIEVDARELTATYKYLGVRLTADTGTNYAAIVAVLSDARYPKGTPLADTA